MKRVATIIVTLTTFLLSTQAQAKHRPYHHHRYAHHHYHHHYGHYGHYLASRWQHQRRRYGYRRYHYDRVGLSYACRRAASMGGPCGCVAEEKIFGRNDHVFNGINLWLAREWLRFPRSAPGPGTAAVWPHHHVEAVVRNNGDGTVTTDGPYGHRRVSLRSVVIVDPHYHQRKFNRRVAGAWPL